MHMEDMNIQRNHQLKQGTYVSTSISLPQRLERCTDFKEQNEEIQIDVRSQDNFSFKFPEFQEQNFSDQFFNKESPCYLSHLIQQPPLQKQSLPSNPKFSLKNQQKTLQKILKQQKFKQKSSNSIRFLVSIALQHICKYTQHQNYTNKQWQNISHYCQNIKKWHLTNKNNVYKFQHLTALFNVNGKENQGKIRNIYSGILRKYSIQAMKNPKSQIQNKQLYLRVAKLFNLRCRNYTLSLRNQCR